MEKEGFQNENAMPYQTAFVLVQKEFEEVEVPPWAIRIYQTEEDGYGLGEKKDEH